MAWLTGYTYCKKITVQTAYLDAALTDFPLVVFIDGDTDIGAHALATGYDIRFTASDGMTLLPYERRSFAIAAGAATGRFIVKTSLATAPATDIYIHYGKVGASDGADAPNAYDANVRAIWPLNESAGGAGAIKDRTSNANHLTDYGSPIFGEAGPIDKAIFLDDVDAYLEAIDSNSLDLAGSFTLSTWIKKTTYGNYCWVLSKQPGDMSANNYPGNYEFRLNGNQPQLNFEYDAPGSFESHSASSNLTDNIWQHLGVVKNALATLTFYIDGVPAGSFASTHAPFINAKTFVIGKRRDNYTYPGFWIAEAGIDAIARSAAWIKFTYRNIIEADHEQTWGAEEVGTVTYTLAGSIAAQSTLSGNLKMTARLTSSISGLSSLTANLTEVFSRLKAILFTAKPRERIVTVDERRRIRVATDRERIVTVDERK